MPSQHTPPTTIEQEKQTIRQVANLSADTEITLNDRGWDSRVYSFEDGRYFFKFPRSERVQKGYQYEVAALKHLASLDTGIHVQNILWEHPEDAYFGYEGVQGMPLSEAVEGLDHQQKEVIGTSIGIFLQKLHTLELPGARTVSLSDEDAQIRRWYEDALPTIQAVFTDVEQRALHALVYETWPARLESLGRDPVLCHGDLHFENILHQTNGQLGIIDFGDVGYFDRSRDLIDLHDPTVSQAAFAAYGKSDENFMHKIQLRHEMIQIVSLGFYAGKGDEDGIERAAVRIREYLSH